jgi:transposase-like protein
VTQTKWPPRNPGRFTFGAAQRDKRAGTKLIRKLLKRQGFVPTVIVIDELGSNVAAFR